MLVELTGFETLVLIKILSRKIITLHTMTQQHKHNDTTTNSTNTMTHTAQTPSATHNDKSMSLCLYHCMCLNVML